MKTAIIDYPKTICIGRAEHAIRNVESNWTHSSLWCEIAEIYRLRIEELIEQDYDTFIVRGKILGPASILRNVFKHIEENYPNVSAFYLVQEPCPSRDKKPLVASTDILTGEVIGL